MKKINIFMIIVLLTNCNYPIYKNKYEKNNTLDKDTSMIVFWEDLHGIKLTNIATKNDIDFKKSNRSNMFGNNGINILIIKPGRYIFSEGFDWLGDKRNCIISALPVLVVGVLTFGILAIHDGMAYLEPQILDPITKKNIPAIMYIDIKPGDIAYIGNIDSRFWHCDIDVEDNFDKTKEKLLKTNPEIANKMIKKIMKKDVKPAECNFLIDEEFKFMFENQDTKKDYKLDIRYPACIEALNKLP